MSGEKESLSTGSDSNSSQSDESLVYDLQMGPKSYGAKAIFRYLRPGAVRISTRSDDSNVPALAFKHEGSRKLTVLIWNSSSSNASVTIDAVAGQPDQWDVYRTGSGNNCVQAGTVAPGGTVTVPGRHIVTLYNDDSHPANFGTATAPAAPPGSFRKAVVGETFLVTPNGRLVGKTTHRTAPGVYFLASQPGGQSGVAAMATVNVR